MDFHPDFAALDWIVLAAYLAAMVTIGVILAGKQHNTEDYFLAGRRMPWLVVAMSMFASLTSAISYMGIPAAAYRENLALLGIGFCSVAVAPMMIFLFFPLYRKLNVISSYEYIFARYGRGARFVVSGLFLAGRLGWLGTVIYAPSLAICVVTGMDMTVALLLMGVLATAYTVMGGLGAVLWTDVAQFTVLVIGAVWVAVSLATQVPGGAVGIVEYAAAQRDLGLWPLELNLFEMTLLGVLLFFWLGMLYDYGADQVCVQRLMSVKNLAGMAKAALLNASFDLVLVPVLLFIGLGLFAYYHGPWGGLPAGISPDQVFPFYIVEGLPVGISGLMIAAVFAAAMSSMDSGINSLSTVVVNDFVRPLRRVPRPDRFDLMLARLLTLAVGATATGVAFFVSRIEHILKASTTFLSLFTGPILALFLLGVLTRRGHFLGWVLGLPFALGCTVYVQFRTEIHWIYYSPISVGLSLLLGYAWSLVIPRPPADPQYTLLGTLADRRQAAEERAAKEALAE